MSFAKAVREKYGPEPVARPAIGAGLAVPGGGGDTAYGMKALSAECDALAAMAADSGRNGALNTAALRLAQLVASGHLTEATLRINLAGAARASGLPQREIDTVLREDSNGALAIGRGQPRAVAPLPDRVEITSWTPPVAPSPEPAVGGPVTPGPPTTDQPSRAPVAGSPADGADGSSSEGPSAEPVEHTSWWFRDLAGVIDGTVTEPGPVHLARQDGHRLFYAGKVNGLIGESESGKTWVALLAVVQALEVGERVLYLDFEDSASGIVGRLRAMGVTESDLGRFAYVDPDETLHLAAAADLAVVLDTHQPTLIVLDGFNAAMTLLGLDLNSNQDATAFSQTVLKRLARTAATIIYIDHLPKNRDAQGKGGIGAQAKRAMTTGCAIRVDVEVEFGRGMTGRLKLTVDKDRAGHVRAVSAGAKDAGMAILASSPDGRNVDMRIEGPDLRSAEERGPWRPTHLMEAVSKFLETSPGPWSTTAIEEVVKGKAEHLRKACAFLVEDGFATRSEGPRRAVMHSSIRPYRDLDSTPSHSVPTPSGTESNGQNPLRPPSPTLGGDGDGVEDMGPRESPLRPGDGDGVEDEPWWQK